MSDASATDIDRIELTARQRERLEEIKEECTDDGRFPKPADSLMIDSLLDTWDAVSDGLYTGSAQDGRAMTDGQSQSNTDRYVDARTLLRDYELRVCPQSGEKEWTKPTPYTPPDNGRICLEHRTYLNHTLEVPCPDCETRMLAPRDTDVWECRYCDTTIERPTDTLVDRLSTASHFQRGMAGRLNDNCPMCGEERSVNGDPDGDLYCDECGDFHAHRFSAKWYAYAHWLHDEMSVRVNREGAI
jgi:ribosomal protein L37AE/L43A